MPRRPMEVCKLKSEIRIKLNSAEIRGKVSASLIDLQGKTICNKQFEGKSELNLLVPESIKSGVYLLKIQGTGINATEK